MTAMWAWFGYDEPNYTYMTQPFLECLAFRLDAEAGAVCEISQEFDGTVIWGEDLMTIRLPALGVGEIESSG